MVETGGLENHCAGNRTGGSNPSPSAINYVLVKGQKNATDFTDTHGLNHEVKKIVRIRVDPWRKVFYSLEEIQEL